MRLPSTPVSVATNSPWRLKDWPRLSVKDSATDLNGSPAWRLRKNSDQPWPCGPATSKPQFDGAKGLRKGEVTLSEVGKQSASYTAMLPQEPRDATFSAMGEAAITANVGNLREWIANNK